MKKIYLWEVDGNTSEIAVWLNCDFKSTGLMVRQERDGTKVWDRVTDMLVLKSKKHYTLCSEKGKQDLADVLEAAGALGKRYYVWKAVQNAEPFNTGDDSVDRKAMACYEDCFVLGEFLTDAEAIAKAERTQSIHDFQASKILKEAGFDDSLGGAGACYTAHLYREEPDGTEVQVER